MNCKVTYMTKVYKEALCGKFAALLWLHWRDRDYSTPVGISMSRRSKKDETRDTGRHRWQGWPAERELAKGAVLPVRLACDGCSSLV